MRGEGAGSIEIERDFDRALAQADVVMMLRIQKERLAGFDLDLAEYCGAVSAERGAAGGVRAEGAGDASGADHSRAGDYGRGGGRAAVGD